MAVQPCKIAISLWPLACTTWRVSNQPDSERACTSHWPQWALSTHLNALFKLLLVLGCCGCAGQHITECLEPWSLLSHSFAEEWGVCAAPVQFCIQPKVATRLCRRGGKTCYIHCSSGVESTLLASPRRAQCWCVSRENASNQSWSLNSVFSPWSENLEGQKKSTSGAGRAMLLFKCHTADWKTISKGKTLLCRIILKIDRLY